jgi:hypothetical protein
MQLCSRTQTRGGNNGTPAASSAVAAAAMNCAVTIVMVAKFPLQQTDTCMQCSRHVTVPLNRL